MTRHTNPSLKTIKRLIARGKYDQAISELMGFRDAKLALVQHDQETMLTYVGLSKIESLLGECYSLSGDEISADEWFKRAFRYVEKTKDPMLKARLVRQEAMHQLRFEHYDLAMVRLADASITMGLLLEDPASELSERRRVTEFYFTVTCQSEVALALEASDVRAYERLREAHSYLLKGSKRRYELCCLVDLIRYGSTLDVKRPFYLTRATFLNRFYVKSFEIDRFLVNQAFGPEALKAGVKEIAAKLS